jgi:hypothetical protein
MPTPRIPLPPEQLIPVRLRELVGRGDLWVREDLFEKLGDVHRRVRDRSSA